MRLVTAVRVIKHKHGGTSPVNLVTGTAVSDKQVGRACSMDVLDEGIMDALVGRIGIV